MKDDLIPISKHLQEQDNRCTKEPLEYVHICNCEQYKKHINHLYKIVKNSFLEGISITNSQIKEKGNIENCWLDSQTFQIIKMIKKELSNYTNIYNDKL